MSTFLAIALFVAALYVVCALAAYALREIGRSLLLQRFPNNPILCPAPGHWWESEAVFNPAAFVDSGKIHLLYRAIGRDGVSRVGHAWSADGVHFHRSDAPAYDQGSGFADAPEVRADAPRSYRTDLYASGGSWGGVEDPRAVVIDGRLYMSFGIFEHWRSLRLAVTSMNLEDLRASRWAWAPHVKMSPPDQTHKNWVLFPEKFGGKFAILHALTPTISIDYVDRLEDLKDNPIQSNNRRGGRLGAWDGFVRGAASPPIKTAYGWLLLYHAMDPREPHVGYKVGAMLLDLDDPTHILHRSEEAILCPEMWYENDWKPGVVYVSGAVIFGDDLLVYYGGGDKYIAAAKMNLRTFLDKLRKHRDIPSAAIA